MKNVNIEKFIIKLFSWGGKWISVKDKDAYKRKITANLKILENFTYDKR